MLDILTPLIVEADSVSQDILDVILGCILEPYKVNDDQVKSTFLFVVVGDQWHIYLVVFMLFS